MHKNKIIGIADISLNFQFVLDELIQLVQIYICEQLGGQITQRQPRIKTLDYFLKEIYDPIVTSSF